MISSMPFFSSSRLAYHCGYKTTAMLCSSGAKNNWQCKLTAVIRRQPCSVAVAPKLSHLSHQCKPCSVAMAPASSPNILFCDDHRELISLWVESLHALTTLFKGLVNDPGSRTLTHPAWSPARSPSRWRVVQAVNSSGQDQHFHRCL